MKPLLLLFIQQIGHLRRQGKHFVVANRVVAFVSSLFSIFFNFFNFFFVFCYHYAHFFSTITMQTWRRIRVKLIFTLTHTQLYKLFCWYCDAFVFCLSLSFYLYLSRCLLLFFNLFFLLFVFNCNNFQRHFAHCKLRGPWRWPAISREFRIFQW